MLSSCNFNCNSPQPEVKIDTTYEYGIIVDSLFVHKDLIKRNQNLSEILSSYKVDYPKIHTLATEYKDIFDVRKIKSGNKYTVICTNDSARKLLYFIYEICPINYIICDFRDSVHAHTGQKEIERKILLTSGIIESSLWNSLVEKDVDPMVAMDLSEIYAWTIDFFGIQKGDKYKIIYESLSVEGQKIGVSKILAASFYHGEKDNYAFYFIQDSVGDYFDEKANSLKRSFLKAPLKFRRISSNFSHSRLHPILKIRRPHLGVDYSAPSGTPVRTIGDGTVVDAKYSGGAGRIITIRHNSTYTTKYLHLLKYAPGIRPGKRVKQGDIIAYVGSSGLSTGAHLDFRFYKNGKPVDPLKVESPPAEPVNKKYKKKYERNINKLKQLLDSAK